MSTWFDILFAEYKDRGEAMFAFSQKQVEEAFEGDLAVTWEQFQAEWVSIGAGLHVKRSVRVKFIHRMTMAEREWRKGIPELRVRYIGETMLDYPAYRAMHPIESLRVKEGQLLVDIEYGAPNEAAYLHVVASEEFPEPSHQLNARLVFEPRRTDKSGSGS
jgi:hypothetical protein